MSLHSGRMYLVVVDDVDETHARLVPAEHAVDAARHVATTLGFGEVLYEGASALGRWTIATADEHRVSAWPAPPEDPKEIAARLSPARRGLLLQPTRAIRSTSARALRALHDMGLVGEPVRPGLTRAARGAGWIAARTDLGRAVTAVLSAKAVTP